MRRCKMRINRSFILVIVALCTLCLPRQTNCDNDGQQNDKKAVTKVEPTEKPATAKNDSLTRINDNKNDVTTSKKQQTAGTTITSKTVAAVVENKVNEQSTSLPEFVQTSRLPTIDSGALIRGFYVLVGLSVVVVAYMVFRSSRVTKQRSEMVRKYGILAHKRDIEMRPLPLDEDDEDDTTLFDASGLSPSRPQS